jgi:peptide/nickel transport system permease protein
MLFRESLKNAFGEELGIFLLVVFIIGVTSWMQTARVVRGDVLSIKEEEFVLAANSIGTRKRNVIMRHILPNTMSPIMVSAALGVATAIITESALSFLGLGVQPPTPAWGNMLGEGRVYMLKSWWIAAFPGLAIFVTTLSINLMGNALRDWLDPHLKL